MADKRIGVQITFEDRTYQLGETIDVAVQLAASKQTNISEIKLLLRCDESYNKGYSGQVFEQVGQVPIESGGSMPAAGESVASKSSISGAHKHHEVIFEDTLPLGANFSMKDREKRRLAGKFKVRQTLPPGDIFEDSLLFTFALEVKYKGLLGSRTETHEKPVKIIPYLSRVKPRNT